MPWPELSRETIESYLEPHEGTWNQLCRMALRSLDLQEALEAIAEGCSFPENDVQRAIRDRARAALSGGKPL